MTEEEIIRDQRIRVLHVLSSLGLGGAETMVMNLYRVIDRDRIEFDFLVSTSTVSYYEKEIPEERSRIYRICKRSESMVRHHAELYGVIKRNRYKTVHFHTQNAFLTCLEVITARLAGAKTIIVHSHNTTDWRSRRMIMLSKLFRPILCLLSDYRLACGESAAQWLYGKAGSIVFPLPVDCGKYRYSAEEYRSGRENAGLRDALILTHVGRFDKVKNHRFILEVFREVLRERPESVLFLIGDGVLRADIEKQAADMGLRDKVIFWGNISDVYAKLKISDVFLLPSLFEGFPTVALEAQAAGLPCYLSDTITDKIAETELVRFLNLSDGAALWAKEILKGRSVAECEKLEANSKIAETYDISVAVEKIEKIYRGK